MSPTAEPAAVTTHRRPGKPAVDRIDSNDRLLSINDVAEICRIHRASVYRLMENGELPYKIVSSRRRIRYSDLLAYIERSS